MDIIAAAKLAMDKLKEHDAKRVYTSHEKCVVGYYRKLLGLTVRDVATGTGLSNAFICQVEHGCEVSLTNARKLATFFGKGIDELWPS